MCPGFVGHTEPGEDTLICVRCHAHKDLHPAPDASVDDLDAILPPSDTGAATAEAVAERQAEAVSDTAPAIGGGAPPVDEGANRLARLEIVRGKFARLDEIAKEKKALTDEEEEIREALEKESGFQRTAVSAVRKLKGLGSAAAIKKHIDNRAELEAIFITPILDEAEAGRADE